VIYPLERFLRNLRRRFSRSEWALRRLHLAPSEDTSSEPGLLLIQIDGLARQQAERAIARGRMPFLRSLMRRQHYEMATFYSGLPSTTPAVQGELFYDVCCAVPAFSFLNREARQITAMFQPEWVKKIEADLKTRGEGLLTGGSSWSNIYTGGAAPEESHFCAASLGPGDFFKSISLLGLLSIVLLQFAAVLRLVGLLFFEAFFAIYDIIKGICHGENPTRELKFFLSRVFVCVGLREVVTIGAAVDLARGLPIVHVNFVGYDEQAHRRGPGSAFAHLGLRRIDAAIKKLYVEAHRSMRREYQVWIYSDHGQESVASFCEEFEPIENVIERGIAQTHKGAIAQGRLAETTSRAFPSHAHSLNRGHRSRRSGGSAGGELNRADTREHAATSEVQGPSPTVASEHQLPEQDAKKLFSVTAMGPVGHLYLAWAMSADDKKAFAQWLVQEGHVPAVLYATEPGQAVWVHPNGTWNLPADAHLCLAQTGAQNKIVARDLVALCEQQYSGDMVLLGSVTNGRPWSFAWERGGHGGPGLGETSGFALLPSKTRLPESVQEFIRPRDLRKAALHRLGRERIPVPKRMADLTPSCRLRVMTYNVHSCLGMDGKISPHRIARVIELYSPDIIALQEIDLGRARTRGHDQARMIAEELHMHVSFCPTVIRGTELYGHALLSRFPLEVICTGALSGGNNIGRREPRGALLAKIELGSSFGSLCLMNTHFGLGRFERAAQIADLMGKKWLGRCTLDQPIIVCGDFNMLPGSLPYRALASRLRDVQIGLKDFRPLKTFAALFPFSRIDHIFVSSHFEVERVQVPQNDLTRSASDHLPLIADLSFKRAHNEPGLPKVARPPWP
jgi:endonuclease/exonuclease/phosphatase family metal-dependent hydrolase